jgi:peptide/nickel transport system substrate-binding protein
MLPTAGVPAETLSQRLFAHRVRSPVSAEEEIMSIRLALRIVVALFAMAVAACAGQPGAAPAPEQPTAAPEQPAATTAPAGPITLRIGWAGSPDSLNPGLGVLTEAYTIYELVYDSMYSLNLDGSLSPELADKIETSTDGRVWTFHIRDSVNFHDGTPLTAEDVAFSYNFYQANEDFPFLNTYTGYFESVEATEGNHVVLTLTEAIPNLDSQLYFLYILPKHIWEGVEAPGEYENPEMIGSGPFKLSEYKQNEFVHLSANKEHFHTPPKIDEVVFQTFENEDALVQAIKTGQVDMITEMPNPAVAALRNEPNVRVVTGAPLAPSVSDIIFNLTTPETCPPDDGVCSGHPALKDIAVRRALAHATDKQKIIDVVLLGLAEPGRTLIPSGLGHWYNDTLEDYAYDLTVANKLLDDAGYADQDSDGVREMPDGSASLVFRLNWPSDSTDAPREAELLSEMWAQIGVKTELQALDPDTLTSICCPAFDYDIILWGWGSDPDPGFLLSVHLSEEIPTGTSESGYSNPVFDELFAQQATALDLDTRRQIIWDMQKTLLDDLPYLIPYYALAVQAYRSDRFSGWITDQPKLSLEDVSSLVVVEPVE